MMTKSNLRLNQFLGKHGVDHISFARSELLLKGFGGKSFVDLVDMGFTPSQAFVVAGDFLGSIGGQGSDEKVLDHYSVDELHARFNATIEAARTTMRTRKARR
ncbi:hypothetical protein ABIB06_002450 [Bradyrhizobium sp. LB8.2]|uniref:hypothetical protein n=1 Tax=unclassified Bradyrhizobium TaxID=2631580 RepID=UPI003391FDCE